MCPRVNAKPFLSPLMHLEAHRYVEPCGFSTEVRVIAAKVSVFGVWHSKVFCLMEKKYGQQIC